MQQVQRLNADRVTLATPGDATEIASLRAAVAIELTKEHGKGHWSSLPTEATVLRALKSSKVLVAHRGGRVVGTLILEARKPWAIDTSYFAQVPMAVYLHDLAVAPDCQRTGIGRLLVDHARKTAKAWPSDAIRLDAYDHAAGAARFYEKCGFSEVGRVVYRGVPLVYLQLVL